MHIFKRFFFVFVITILIIPVTFFLFLLVIGPALNDAKAKSIEKGLVNITLPADIEIIETASYCGNTSGTGNHVEILAGMLIRSKLPEEEIYQYYCDYEIVRAVPANEKIYIELRNYMKFPYLCANGDREDCYIVTGYFEAATQIDIRGH